MISGGLIEIKIKIKILFFNLISECKLKNHRSYAYGFFSSFVDRDKYLFNCEELTAQIKVATLLR